jgi:hypothetical protein
MIETADFDTHLRLVSRMSDTLDADLGAALAEGRLTGAEMRAAVDRCCDCREVDACTGWLKANAAGADAPPGYCRNAELMVRLAEG